VNNKILPEKALPDIPDTKENRSIGFVGDIVPEMNASYNMFSEIPSYTEDPDIMIGNLEGVVSDNTYTKCNLGSSNCFSFNGGTEWYLGENRGDVRTFAHNAIDAGADVVLGSGPHVLRDVEKYKNKLIAYSLGNFLPADKLTNNDSSKNSAMIEITFNKDADLIGGTVIPFEIDNSGVPHYDLSKTSISVINELSKKDFGESGVSIDDFGTITQPATQNTSTL
jgi:hypothetical protein